MYVCKLNDCLVMYRRKQLVPSLAAFLPGNRNYSVKKPSKEVRYEEVGASFYAKNIGIVSVHYKYFLGFNFCLIFD